ncbi:nicotinate-nucleotide adenylyltransferase [Citricoccus muralis]|uniref:Probable nicotinate-nucleotide adenylyltransferase n=2 Tax=Citricoccus muralis TaxID=169134 RepID=A0A3D9LAJ1_9MICC|nr:nicotinate-nucleotide adenylyltransferase [Citricoccus muralis]REE02880.1 nicotinate-nucleotide adenylyltransferase [Citricoccus muralis]
MTHRRFRLGIMGGTFDPIHHGHLVAASEVASELGLDEVVFVPTGQPWQKDAGRVSPAEHRYLMTVVATASNPRFTVSRVDIDRPGPTYTADTLRDLKTLRPEAELFFITGADALEQIMTWKNVEKLWDMAQFVGVTRPGHDLVELGPETGIKLMEIPAMSISSTDCRVRVQGGKPVWYLVPDGVVQYIAKHNLYLPSAHIPGGGLGGGSGEGQEPFTGGSRPSEMLPDTPRQSGDPAAATASTPGTTV